MAVPETITRTQVPVNENDPDGEYIRVYFDPTTDAPPMPSVSVIKGVRTDPEKEEALDGWRDRFDGQSQWSRPWYEDQKMFKAYRGTLIHFAILDELGDAAGDTYFHEVGDDEWGHEEYYAEYCLKKWSTKAPSANTDEVPYTPRNNQYDGEHAWDKACRDMLWATSQFKEQIIDGAGSQSEASSSADSSERVRESGRLDPANVIDVEEYVYDTEYGYGGQFDLLYEDDDGDIILSDLKTSSAIRFDHKLQSAAYKRAIESREDITIDQTEVIRLHPDSETVEVERSNEWDRTLDGLAHQFLGLCDHANNVVYDDVLKRAKEELLDTEHASSSHTELAAASD